MNNEILNKKNEPDLDRILDILHQVPQEEIPVQFEERLRKALKEEAKIIAAKNNNNSQKKNYNKILKIAMSAAACFIVGFISISMYNDGIDLLSQDTAINEEYLSFPEENPADKELSSPQDGIETERDSGISEQDQSNMTIYGMAGTGNAQAAEAGNEPVPGLTDNADDVKMRGFAPDATVSEDAGESYSQEESLTELKDNGKISRHGSKFNTLTEDFLIYNSLVNEYLAGMEYELISYTRDFITGEHIFNILVKKDAEGNLLNSPIILTGSEGEVYEQQRDEQPVGCD